MVAVIAAGWTKTLLFIVLAPLIGFALGFVFMVAISWIMRPVAPSRVDRYFRKLQLLSAAMYSLGHGANDAQKQQIHALMKQAMTAEHADMENYHASFGHLKTLLAADPIDDTAIATLRTEQDRLALSASRRLSDTAVAVAHILTPAQRVKLGAEIDQMMDSHMAQHHAM